MAEHDPNTPPEPSTEQRPGEPLLDVDDPAAPQVPRPEPDTVARGGAEAADAPLSPLEAEADPADRQEGAQDRTGAIDDDRIG